MFDKSTWLQELCQNNLEKTVVTNYRNETLDEEIIGQIKSNAKILSFSTKTKQITTSMLKENASLKERDNLTLINHIQLIHYKLYWFCSKKDFYEEEEKYIKRKAGFKP